MVRNNFFSATVVLIFLFSTAVYAHASPVHIVNNTGYQVAGTIYYDVGSCKLCTFEEYSIAPHGQWRAAKRTTDELVGDITVHHGRFWGKGYQSSGTTHSEFEVIYGSDGMLQVRSRG